MPSVDALLPLTALSLVGLLVVSVVGQRSQTLAPVLVGYCGHLMLGLGNYWINGLVADQNTFNGQAMSVAASLSGDSGTTVSLNLGKEGFPFIVGLLYTFAGPYPELGLALNAILMGLVPAIVATACRGLGYSEAAVIAAWFVVVLPPLAYWTSLFAREAMASFFLSLMLLALSLLYEGRIVRALVVAWSSTAAMMFVRPQVGALALAGIVIAALIMGRGQDGTVTRALVLAAPSVALLPLGFLRGPDLDPTSAGSLREGLGEGANTATGVTGDGFDTTFGALVGSLLDLPRATLGPLPWEWSVTYWQLIIDVVSWAVVLIFAFIALRRAKGRRVLISLLVPAALVLLATSAIMGNWGIVVRMRLQALPFLIVIAAVGFQIWRAHAHEKVERRVRSRRYAAELERIRKRKSSPLSVSSINSPVQGQ